jgi:hypothetical protein
VKERKETYLGGGLYASFDGWHICLRAPREGGGDSVVYLEHSVLDALMEYVESLRTPAPLGDDRTDDGHQGGP